MRLRMETAAMQLLLLLLFACECFQQEYILENICDPYRRSLTADEHCERQRKEEIAAFHILATGQFLAGVAAAPFNTIAYVYIDDNLENKALSPFFLGNAFTDTFEIFGLKPTAPLVLLLK